MLTETNRMIEKSEDTNFLKQSFKAPSNWKADSLDKGNNGIIILMVSTYQG
jgi:hypothetical protein